MINILVGKEILRGRWLPAYGLGLSLRELIHEYKHQTLVLFKCCLLQPKVTKTRKKSGCLLKLVDAFLRFPL